MCVGGRQREKEWEREWEKRRLNLKIFYATEYIFSNKWEKKSETYTTYIIIFDLMLSRFGYCHLHIFNFLYFFSLIRFHLVVPIYHCMMRKTWLVQIVFSIQNFFGFFWQEIRLRWKWWRLFSVHAVVIQLTVSYIHCTVHTYA